MIPAMQTDRDGQLVTSRTCHVCPACLTWQLDYSQEALVSYVGTIWPPADAVRVAHALVEHALLEHLWECFGIPRGGPPPVCPECRNGKHQNCDEEAWDDEADAPVSCTCAAAGHPEVDR